MCHLVNMAKSDFEELLKNNFKKIGKARQTKDETVELISYDWIRV
jgi:hypothetical protein